MQISKTDSKTFNKDAIDAMKLLGFTSIGADVYQRVDELDAKNTLICYATVSTNMIDTSIYLNAVEHATRQFKRIIDFIDYIEQTFAEYGVSAFELIESETILCASNSRDLAKKLQRVKSSNVWSYAFNPKDMKVGDMLMQFKNKDGGAGDIYIYYDVPNKVWRQLVGAASKGHAFWKLVRNIYTYAKLTGDKRTHLPNGI